MATTGVPEEGAHFVVEKSVCVRSEKCNRERMEIGCHHAEMNVICNAAANGVPTRDAWLLVTGEPA